MTTPPAPISFEGKKISSDQQKKTEATSRQNSTAVTQAHPIGLRKPFPWPFFLAMGIPLLIGGILYRLWDQQDILMILRVGWVALCSLIPGLAIMVIIGSLAQIRNRPIFGFLSFAMGGAMLWGCWWGFQQVMEHAPTLLR